MTTQRSERIAGALGLASVALVVVGFVLILKDAPGNGDSDREIVSYFTDHKDAISGGAALLFVGVLAFLPFVTRLRAVLHAGEGDAGGPSAVALGAGIAWGLFVVAGLTIVSAIPGALDYAKPFTIDPDTARLVSSMTWAPVVVYGGIAAAVLIAATSLSARRTGVLPRAFVRAGYALAPIELIGAFVGFAPPLFMLWIAAASVILIARSRSREQSMATAQPAAGLPA